MTAAPLPETVRLQHGGTALVLQYGTDEYVLSAEFLRVHSPSAEVRGHGRGQEVLQTGKAHVRITALHTAGNYALKPVFSDGHDSGLYDWSYLYRLCRERQTLWSGYLKRLEAAAASRFPAAEQP